MTGALLKKAIVGASCGALGGTILSVGAFLANSFFNGGVDTESDLHLRFRAAGRDRQLRYVKEVLGNEYDDDLLVLWQYKEYNRDAHNTALVFLRNFLDTRVNHPTNLSSERRVATLTTYAKKVDRNLRRLLYSATESKDRYATERIETALGNLHVKMEEIVNDCRRG